MLFQRLNRLRLPLLVAGVFMAVVGAIASSSFISSGQEEDTNPATAPLAELVVPEFAQSIVTIVEFDGPTNVSFVEAAVSQSPPPARIAGPPSINVQAVDSSGFVLEQYDDWHPLEAEFYNDEEDGEDKAAVMLDRGRGRFIVRFSPELEMVRVTDISNDEGPVHLIDIDVRPIIDDYCAANPRDPGCEPGCPEDVDGDGKVTGRDISAVARAMASTPDDPHWNADADINQDGTVDVADLQMVLKALVTRSCG